MAPRRYRATRPTIVITPHATHHNATLENDHNLLGLNLGDCAFVLCRREQTDIGKLSNGHFDLFDRAIRIVGNVDVHRNWFAVMVELRGHTLIGQYSGLWLIVKKWSNIMVIYLFVQTCFEMDFIWFQHKLLAHLDRRLLTQLRWSVHYFADRQPHRVSLMRLVLSLLTDERF